MDTHIGEFNHYLAVLAVLAEAGVEALGAAGNSLGEYPALVAAGVIEPV